MERTLHGNRYLISWTQCMVVVWLVTASDSREADMYTQDRNRGSAGTESRNSTLAVASFMPHCPPPNDLHLVCDKRLVRHALDCAERAYIIQHCLNEYHNIYNESTWTVCEVRENYCEDVIVVLERYKFILPRTTRKPHTVLPSLDDSSQVIPTSFKSLSTSPASSNNSATSSVTASVVNVTVSSQTSVMTSPQGSTNMDESVLVPSSDTSPPVSYVYPIFGSLCILCEIVILVVIYCYQRRKNGSRSGSRNRRQSKDNLVAQEQMIEPESASPTKALYIHPHNEEDILKEDSAIYKSYADFRYIDDVSLGGTPEKVILK